MLSQLHDKKTLMEVKVAVKGENNMAALFQKQHYTCLRVVTGMT